MRSVFLAVLALTPGCSLLGISPRQVPYEHHEVTTPSGVIVQDILAGTGPAVLPTSEVTLNYVARVQGGGPIDSSYDRGLPISFRMGRAPILGWNEGLLGMRPGGRRHLVVPPYLAYGDDGVEGVVPPRATLEFDIELVEAKPSGADAPDE
jgi:peptidylprolyl isomerase